jgi:precorrin-6A/cobalt-precorrin-6A reductase
MRILLLGGVGEAVQLARRLAGRYELTYSLAGRARPKADLPYSVRVGGFGGVTGLRDFLRQEFIELLLDVTHPYADQISRHAVLAARQAGIPVWAYRRPPWQPETGDNWWLFRDWSELRIALAAFYRPLFTIGLEPLRHVHEIGPDQHWLVRCLEAQPEPSPRLTVLNAIGPFSLEEELQRLRHCQADLLISKNSGGKAVAAKLQAARLTGIPVLMWQRPELPAVDEEFDAVETIAGRLGC